MSKPKQNPYALALFGLLIFVFGVVDVLFVNATVGAIMIGVGLLLGIAGLNRAKKPKK